MTYDSGAPPLDGGVHVSVSVEPDTELVRFCGAPGAAGAGAGAVAGGVSAGEAHTAIAPPLAARCSVSARLSSSNTPLKRPLKQFIATTNGSRARFCQDVRTSSVGSRSVGVCSSAGLPPSQIWTDP